MGHFLFSLIGLKRILFTNIFFQSLKDPPSLQSAISLLGTALGTISNSILFYPNITAVECTHMRPKTGLAGSCVVISGVISRVAIISYKPQREYNSLSDYP